LYNRDGLPTGSSPGDYIVNANPANAGETLLLTTNSPPGYELRPGQRYYLGVVNANPSETNSFTLSVAFDQIDTSLISVIALTNGICYSNTVPVTNALDYYQFTVFFQFTIDQTNATVSFWLYNLNNPADLLVDLGALPDPATYLFSSSGSTNNPAQILVDTNGYPPELNGDWYLAVDNLSTNDLSFTILASLSTNGLPTNNIVINPQLIIT